MTIQIADVTVIDSNRQLTNITAADATTVASLVAAGVVTTTATQTLTNKTVVATSATKLATARTIGGVSFDGTINISLPGVNIAGNQSTTGNAATATKLATAVTINGTSFDGSAGITLDVNTTAVSNNQNYYMPFVSSLTNGTNKTLYTSGAIANSVLFNPFTGTLNVPGGIVGTATNAQTANKLTTATTINGASFDGSVAITVPVNTARLMADASHPIPFVASTTAGNQQLYTDNATTLNYNPNTNVLTCTNISATTFTGALTGNATTATTLATARTINGTSFNGSANITVPVNTSQKSDNVSYYIPFVASLTPGNQDLFTDSSTTDAAFYNPSTNLLNVANLQAKGVRATENVILVTGGTTEKQVVWTMNSAETDKVYFYGNPTNRHLGLYDTISAAARWVSYPTGDFVATGNVTAYSDVRLKADITKIVDAIEKIKQLSGYTFTRTDTNTRQTGVLAHEVEAVLPEAVIRGEEYLSVAYGNMIGLLIEGIKELTARIEVLESKQA